MRCSSLISGSKANSFYIESCQDALLIDAGLSLSQLDQTLYALKVDREKLRGILLTHEHEDHIRYLKRISHAYKLPVYLTEESYHKSGITLKDFHIIRPGDMLDFGSIQVDTFEVLHDSVMCLGFMFFGEDKSVFYASDIGSYDDEILKKAENANFIGIESNYEPKMLAGCKYPQYLKNRISGGEGHLSNHQAVQFVKNTVKSDTRHVMFLHISENSNCVSHIERMIDQDLFHCFPDVRYTITSRRSYTPLITI